MSILNLYDALLISGTGTSKSSSLPPRSHILPLPSSTSILSLDSDIKLDLRVDVN